MKFLFFGHSGLEAESVFRRFYGNPANGWSRIRVDRGEQIPDDLSRFAALVIAGGPVDIWRRERYEWLAPELAAIRRFVVDMARPVLGVCLGHLLLAEALGGMVGPASAAIGVSPVRRTAEGAADPLLKDLTSPLLALQWHRADIKTLPADAVILAENHLCRAQSFRWRNHAYGLQLLVEATADTASELSRQTGHPVETNGRKTAASRKGVTPGLLSICNETTARLIDRFQTMVRA